MKNCVISVGVGGNYPLAVQRLCDSLAAVKYKGQHYLWQDEYPEGSPSHQQVQYAFKTYAFQYAMNYGYENILWLDASIIAIRPIDKVFDFIRKRGWLFYGNGFNCGQWCTDDALALHGLTRDQAINIPDFTGCIIGLNAKSLKAMRWFNSWMRAANDGISFNGPHSNSDCRCSQDPRCLGHRHDQVIGSILAHKKGMRLDEAGPGSFFSYKNDLLFTPPYKTVCLVNAGR